MYKYSFFMKEIDRENYEKFEHVCDFDKVADLLAGIDSDGLRDVEEVSVLERDRGLIHTFYVDGTKQGILSELIDVLEKRLGVE